MLQIVWLRERESKTNERLGFNCCIRLLIDHITNKRED
jgi:hypothetical protein